MGNFNISGGWDRLWSAVTSGFPNLTLILNILALIIIVLAGLKWIWARKRGNGNSKDVGMALVIGAILAAPGLLVPIALKVIDWLLNIGANLLAILG